MSDKDNIIVKCAKVIQEQLNDCEYTNDEKERILNEWIKEALKYSKNNPELTKEQLESFLLNENKTLK